MANRTTASEQAPKTISGEDARQGEIILRRRWQRVVFIAGLAGIVLLVLLLSLI